LNKPSDKLGQVTNFAAIFVKDNNRRRFISNTFMQYLMIFATYAFPLVTFPYLTRILKPEMYGVITFLTATVNYFQLFIDFGFNLSATKDIAANQNDKNFIGFILGVVIEAKMFLVLLALILYSVLVFHVPLMRKNILLSFLYFGTVILSIWLPDYLFRGIEKMGILTVRFVISKTVATILVFVFIASPKDVLWIPILNILASSIAVGMTYYALRKRLDIRAHYTGVRNVMTKLQESSIYFCSTFATTAYGAINTFMLGVMALPADQIGYWGVAYTLISSAQSMFSPIINSVYPHMVAKKDFNLINTLLKILMPAIIIISMLVFCFSENIILLLAGKAYVEAVPVLRALIFVLIFSFPAMLIGFPVLGVVGKVKQTTATTILSGGFHVLGLSLFALTGRFTVLNIAVLRSCTEAVLLGARMILLALNRKSFTLNGQQ